MPGGFPVDSPGAAAAWTRRAEGAAACFGGGGGSDDPFESMFGGSGFGGMPGGIRIQMGGGPGGRRLTQMRLVEVLGRATSRSATTCYSRVPRSC